VIFLHGRLSCIHTMCPTHLNLVFLIAVTRSVSPYKWYSSSWSWPLTFIYYWPRIWNKWSYALLPRCTFMP
jgi:hypothetical protein